jgi:hypothetical protein
MRDALRTAIQSHAEKNPHLLVNQEDAPIQLNTEVACPVCECTRGDGQNSVVPEVASSWRRSSSSVHTGIEGTTVPSRTSTQASVGS